ncbi:hypothetical protein GGD61_007638 [Bradyrhizobium sp. SBR1B]|nr:hypothetical protein [Bradyrhizobium sp. SBR1B]
MKMVTNFAATGTRHAAPGHTSPGSFVELTGGQRRTAGSNCKQEPRSATTNKPSTQVG